MKIVQNQSIQQVHGRPVLFDLYLPNIKVAPLVIFCHGFKGFKDWGAWHLMASHAAQKGFAFAKFNFSHNGITADNLNRFNDVEGFKQNTTSKELADLNVLLSTLCQRYSDHFDTRNISLIGHSRGGPIAILHAVQDARIRQVITWNSVSDLRGWIDKYDPDLWKKNGQVIIKNARTGEQLPMGYTYYQDLVLHAQAYDVLAAVSKLSVPYSIFHAENDEAVPLQAAQELEANCPLSQSFIIPSTGHTFGNRHPWKENRLPEPLRRVLDLTLSTITRN